MADVPGFSAFPAPNFQQTIFHGNGPNEKIGSGFTSAPPRWFCGLSIEGRNRSIFSACSSERASRCHQKAGAQTAPSGTDISDDPTDRTTGDSALFKKSDGEEIARGTDYALQQRVVDLGRADRPPLDQVMDLLRQLTSSNRRRLF